MQQLSFDFNRADRRGWINQAEIDDGHAIDGAKVSSSTMVALLRQIEDYLGENEWAFPSQETLARDLKVCTRTVRRATEALIAQSLLITQLRKNRYGTTTLHYKIVWSELQLLEPSRREQWRQLLKQRTSPRYGVYDTAPHRHGRVHTDPQYDAQPAMDSPQDLATPQSPSQVETDPQYDRPGCTIELVRTERPKSPRFGVPRTDDRSDMGGYRSDMTPHRSDIVTDRSDIVSPKPSINPQLNSPPPPSVQSREWIEVEEEVLSLGVSKAEEAIAIAATNGATPGVVRDLIAIWRSVLIRSPSHWQAPEFVLYRRLVCYRAGQDLQRGWIGGLHTPGEQERERYERSREHSRKETRKLIATANAADAASPDLPEWRQFMQSIGESKDGG